MARGSQRITKVGGTYCLVTVKTVPIHIIYVEIFDRIGENFDLLVALEENTEDHKISRLPPL